MRVKMNPPNIRELIRKKILSPSSNITQSALHNRVAIKPEYLLPQNLRIEPNSSSSTTPDTATILLANSSTLPSRPNSVNVNRPIKSVKKSKNARKLPVAKKMSPLSAQTMRTTQSGNQINVYTSPIRKDNVGSNEKNGERKATTTLIEINTLPSGATTTTTTTTTTTLNEQRSSPLSSTPPPDMKSGGHDYEKSENKTAYSSDILSMVLNEKKNSLMRDPEIIRFLANIHMNLLVNRVAR